MWQPLSQQYKPTGKIINRPPLLRSCSVDDRPIKYMWSIGGMKLQGNPEILGENYIPVPLCALKIKYGLVWDWTRGPLGDRLIYPWHSSWNLLKKWRKISIVRNSPPLTTAVIHIVPFNIFVMRCLWRSGFASIQLQLNKLLMGIWSTGKRNAAA